jgi:hypothetical protein
MTATSKPTPGSAAGVLDVVVRSVTEGRYRYAQLHLMWSRGRVAVDELAGLVSQASTVPDLPPTLTAGHVIATTKPQLLPGWLSQAIDVEIGRICSGLPVASSSPGQLVARITAAVCIDVAADTFDAAARVERPDTLPAAAPRSRLIHLGAPEVIALDETEMSEPRRLLPPPLR